MAARLDKGSHTRATTHGACAATVQDDISCMLIDVDLLPSANAGEQDVSLSVLLRSLYLCHHVGLPIIGVPRS